METARSPISLLEGLTLSALSGSYVVRSPRVPALLAVCSAALSAGFWSVLLAGRSLPWQATRWWLLVFALVFLATGVSWWQLWAEIYTARVPISRRLATALLGAVPASLLAAVVLGLAYTSDRFAGLLQLPEWHMQIVAAGVLLLVTLYVAQRAAIGYLRHGNIAVLSALATVMAERSGLIVLGCLAAVGSLEAAASVAPIGDDIWHFIPAANALRFGMTYPVSPVSQNYQATGMSAVYPALPFYPALMALSFSLFGYNLVGVALPTVVAKALYLPALYAASRSVIGSRIATYSVAILLFLFPIYQIDILGSPEPDTVFVVLLLGSLVFVARATSSTNSANWICMAAFMGLASLTRPEGILYSLILFMLLFTMYRSRVSYWLAAVTYLLVLSPFIAVYHSQTNNIWPTTFGGTLGWQNLEANLSILGQSDLDWYSQAVGLSPHVLVGLLVAAWLGGLLGGLMLWRNRRPLAFISIAGMGNIAAGFLVHPRVMDTVSPVEFLRHNSFGIPFAVLSLAYACYVGSRWLMERISVGRTLFVGLVVVLVVAGVCYEANRLARPEWYFGGQASLLWTGGGYLLTDVIERPSDLPFANDPRRGEQLRVDLVRQLSDVSLRRVNRSEPYHWTSLLVVLYGFGFALAGFVLGEHRERDRIGASSTLMRDPDPATRSDKEGIPACAAR